MDSKCLILRTDFVRHILVRFVCVRFFSRAVVVAQLVEQSLPIPEVHGSNPVVRKIYWTIVFCQLYWKDENKEKEAGNGPFFIKKILFYSKFFLFHVLWHSKASILQGIMILMANHSFLLKSLNNHYNYDQRVAYMKYHHSSLERHRK